MKLSKKTLLYTAYIIGITVFFLYYLFPSDTVKMYLAHRLSQGDPDLAVTIDRVSPALPPGIRLHDVGIAYRNETLIDLDSVKLMPGLLSLFTSKTNVNFKGQVNTGKLSGQAELDNSPKTQSVKIDGQLAGVQIQNIPALQRLSAHKISGGLGGDFTYAATGPNQSLTSKLMVSDCRIELDSPVFSQKALGFKDIVADLVLNKKTLIIKNCTAKGTQLDVNINGTIALNGAVGLNRLNLTGSVTPHHAFLAQIEKSIPMDFLRSKKGGKTAIPFKISGTLDNPGFSLN